MDETVNELVCCRCGHRQEVAETMTAEDGTPLSVVEYMELLGIAGGELCCADCADSSDEVIGRIEP